MEIRRIGLTEANLVFELFDKYRQFYRQSSDRILAETFIGQRLSNNESVIFVAIDNDVPVGFTQLYPKYSSVSASKNWILNDLFVDGSARKSGVGRALIEKAMQFAKGQGATYVQLETAVDNFTAQSLYEAIGFVKQEPETGYLLYKISV